MKRGKKFSKKKDCSPKDVCKKEGLDQNIPLELLVLILTFLPAKSLVRFKLVSKSWKLIIEDPSFSRKHLKHCASNTQNSYLIFSEKPPRGWAPRCVLRNITTLRKAAKKLEFSPADDDEAATNITWETSTTLDGLILLSGYESRSKNMEGKMTKVALWNHSIQKSVSLPPLLPLPTQPHGFLELKVHLSLLFDEVNDDYKVVMIRHKSCIDGTNSKPLVDLFSLKSYSWQRVVDANDTAVPFFIIKSSVSIGGSAHWIGVDLSDINIGSITSLRLVSFHLVSNTLSFNPLPLDPTDVMPKQGNLIVLPESTLGFSAQIHEFVIIWAMEEKSASSASRRGDTSPPESCSWTQRYKIKTSDLIFTETFSVRLHNNHNLLLLWGSKSLHSYDLDQNADDDGELELLLDNYLFSPNYVAPYTESLVLLDYNMATPGGVVPSPQSTG